MRMEQVEEENIENLRKKRDDKKKELELLKNTSPEEMWNFELDNLVRQYNTYRRNRLNRKEGVDGPKKKNIKAKIKGKSKSKIKKIKIKKISKK